MKNHGQLYDDVSEFTLSGKVSIDDMNKVIYDHFKKRRIGLLNNSQLEILITELKVVYETNNYIPISCRNNKKS